MADITPDKLILKCYGHKTKDGKWVGVCLNLNLAAEAETSADLIKKMNEVIITYIETVLNTEDEESIPDLLSRRAPARDWLKYYFIGVLFFVTRFREYLTFKEAVPFHLAHSC